MDAVTGSRGRIAAVSDEQILDAYQLLASREGVFCEPASAASVAGILAHGLPAPEGGEPPELGRLRAHGPRPQGPRHRARQGALGDRLRGRGRGRGAGGVRRNGQGSPVARPPGTPVRHPSARVTPAGALASAQSMVRRCRSCPWAKLLRALASGSIITGCRRRDRLGARRRSFSRCWISTTSRSTTRPATTRTAAKEVRHLAPCDRLRPARCRAIERDLITERCRRTACGAETGADSQRFSRADRVRREASHDRHSMLAASFSGPGRAAALRPVRAGMRPRRAALRAMRVRAAWAGAVARRRSRASTRPGRPRRMRGWPGIWWWR